MPQHLKIDRGTWVVVCDGTKALILENEGDKLFANLKTKETYHQDDPPTHEQGTDAPGRVFQSVGSTRSAVEQTDWHAQAEQRFLTKLASRLDHALMDKATKSLIVVAPPRAIGVLRHAYTARIKDALVAEVEKDYVKLPVHEIEKHLVGPPRPL